jgi:hypothetical protein
MDRQAFTAWLEAYKRAWETKDPGAAGALFTPEATYHENPFEEPFRGREAIIEYWGRVTASQEGIRFSYEIVTVDDEVGVNRWRCSFHRVPTGAEVKIDGTFVVRLNVAGLCTAFREWWVVVETPVAG